MVFLALVAAVLTVFLLQKHYYKKHAFDNVTYRMNIETFEVFEDDEIYVYEELSNNKILPLPYLKVDAELPEGLAFHLVEDDIKCGMHDTFPRVLSSIFILKSREKIRRRWRLRCLKRGIYTLGKATVMTDDILGMDMHAKFFVPIPGDQNTLTVLPKAIDLEKEFTTSKYCNGDFSGVSSFLTDPLLKAGVREYRGGDPINRINWKQTAVHQTLLVNEEEYTEKQQFNIVMNLQTRDVDETVDGIGKEGVEYAVTVVASILDRVAYNDIPVRLFCNTHPLVDGLNAAIDEGDEVGVKIFASDPYRGVDDMLSALRMLAELELNVSVPIENMLDHITENPYLYTRGGNIVFVSAYLSERMINFYYNLRDQGINMIFYITSTLNASSIPDDIDVRFRIHPHGKEIKE